MKQAQTIMALAVALSAASAALILPHAARAQAAPDTENGRYTLAQTPDGFLRLDTKSGAVSICTNKGGWACRLVPDERTAFDNEIGRLMKDNEALRAQLAQNTQPNAQAGGVTSKPAAGDKDKDTTIELRIPSQDKIAAALDRVWQNLLEMAARVQKRLSENI